MYNSARREIVLDASYQHYDRLRQLIEELVEMDPVFALSLTLSFRGVKVDLDIMESLIVINSIAVKRAAFRGGGWSKVGKNIEKPLMLTLCKLYQVPAQHYLQNQAKALREVDFYLIDSEKSAL